MKNAAASSGLLAAACLLLAPGAVLAAGDGGERMDGATLAAQPLTTFQDCETCPTMVVIPPGEFVMGPTPQEQKDMFIGVVPHEHPPHPVTIAKAFALGQLEVTTAQFDAYVRETGAKTGGTCLIRLIEKGPLALQYEGTLHPDNGKVERGPYVVLISDGSHAQPGLPVTGSQPAVCVTRDDITGYLEWLSVRTGRPYRLPSEAEWEYAARAGTTTIGFWGDDFADACDYANFADRDSGYQAGLAAPCAEAISPDWTAEAGSYEPNPWGLHDMAGNVQEVVADCWHDSYEGAPADGSAWLEPDCVLWVARGGDYELLHVSMRASERLFFGYVKEAMAPGTDPENPGGANVMGFRVAADLE